MACSLPIFYCLIPIRNLLLTLLLVFLGGSPLLAQCDRIGRVVRVTPECGGAVMKDVSTGQFFRAVSGTGALLGGETIRFGASAAPALSCAADGLPTMTLTCISDLLAIEARFAYTVSPDNPLQYTFQAELDYAEAQACQWSFGDGPLTTFPDSSVQYTFPRPGLYTVCLKITDDYGITIHGCREILVSAQTSTPCGYDAFVTAVGTQLYGKLLPQSSNAGMLTAIGWHNGENGPLLGDRHSLVTALPGFGVYSICAKYEVNDSVAGTLCQASICKVVSLPEPACTNPHAHERGANMPNDRSPGLQSR